MGFATVPAKRSYQSWIANETLEDYSLRYAAKSFRRWSPFIIANTTLDGISFLALEAIGGAITLSYGFSNAFAAILVVCLSIFVTSLPIAYYSSKYHIDIDLLTRGAGFGCIGSRAGISAPRLEIVNLRPEIICGVRERETWP